MKLIKKTRLILVGILIVFVAFISFTIWDNYRIKVVKENIFIQDLPDELEGFRILQITDLHEKEFGKKQKRLLKTINLQTYDVIVFTGDMLTNRESTNYEPFYSILEGIDNNEHMIIVPGNADPPSYQYYPNFQKSEFVTGIEERGATFLESSTTVHRNGEKIHFVNFELAIVDNPEYVGQINGSFQARYPSNKQYKAYQKELWTEMVQGDVFNSSDIVIALNHFPIPDIRADYIKDDPNTTWRNFDLIIAGHYHGGQIRLPLIGALFIPEPWYEPNSFFPPQDRVKGLWEYEQTKQYVSAGLGTSDAISFLKFRLFNTPEINVLTLKSK